MDNIYSMGAPKWRKWVFFWINKIISMQNAPEYDDNTAALEAGLSIGDIYRTVDTLKIVHE